MPGALPYIPHKDILELKSEINAYVELNDVYSDRPIQLWVQIIPFYHAVASMVR